MKVMEKVKVLKLFIILLVVVLMTSCQNKISNNVGSGMVNEPAQLENKTYGVDEFFDIVYSANINYEKDEALYLNVMWNKDNGEIEIISAEKKELDFMPLFKTGDNLKETKKYIVYCENGDKSWQKTCSGEISCGTLVVKCLDEGGCAKICNANVVYIPEINVFVVDPTK